MDHLNTKLVHYSDPNCIITMSVIWILTVSFLYKINFLWNTLCVGHYIRLKLKILYARHIFQQRKLKSFQVPCRVIRIVKVFESFWICSSHVATEVVHVRFLRVIALQRRIRGCVSRSWMFRFHSNVCVQVSGYRVFADVNEAGVDHLAVDLHHR